MNSSAVIADVRRDVIPQAEPGSVLASGKLQPWHLERRAVVYVRQSSPQQVLENRGHPRDLSGDQPSQMRRHFNFIQRQRLDLIRSFSNRREVIADHAYGSSSSSARSTWITTPAMTVRLQES